jgi:hypothetical protein
VRNGELYKGNTKVSGSRKGLSVPVMKGCWWRWWEEWAEIKLESRNEWRSSWKVWALQDLVSTLIHFCVRRKL